MPDLRTEKQKERDARDCAIFNDYIRIRKEQPSFSKHRVHCYLAEQYGMSYPGIANIIKARGVND